MCEHWAFFLISNKINMENIVIQTETPSDESIHAQQELLDQWVVDLIDGIEPDFWWVY
jgi:hypothetical protein